jgi:hypothetical protein
MKSYLLVTLGLLSSACLGPNPWLKIDDDEDGSSSDGDGDDEQTGDGDGEGDGDGDGDGEQTGDGDGDGDGDSCSNGRQDGDETDLDCGGSCAPCDPGASCESESDCSSGVCVANSCAAPSCEDQVRNGDELEVDCGGSCRFCEHSGFISEFDDFAATDAMFSGVAMYEDGSFAVLYTGIPTGEYRLRWFDDKAGALGPSVPLTPDITMPVLASQALVAGELATRRTYSIINGFDSNSTTRDVFVVERGPNWPAKHWPIYQGPAEVSFANMVLDGEVGTFVWRQDTKLKFRRRYMGNGDNEFIDPQAFDVDPDFTSYDAFDPTIAQRNGVTVVAWARCPVGQQDQCTIALRRFDEIWLELSPVTLPSFSHWVRNPKVAIGEDGRVGLTFFNDTDDSMWAALFDPELTLEGAPWKLQSNLPYVLTVGDVAALSDGSFAFAWPDRNDNRVHIRRFVSPDVPVVTNVGDEAPWPITFNPIWVSISAASNLVAVTWTGRVDGVYQIQGQVLSY